MSVEGCNHDDVVAFHDETEDYERSYDTTTDELTPR